MKDIVITGLGAVTSVGDTLPETWEALQRGESGASKVTEFDTDDYRIESDAACDIKFDPTDHETVDQRNMGKFAQISVIATAEALDDAGFGRDPDWENPRDVGVSYATCQGGGDVLEGIVRDQIDNNVISSRASVRFLYNLAAGHISMAFDAQGPNRSETTACAAGTHAICTAFDELQLGRADVMIAGGSDAGLSPSVFAGFSSMCALSTDADSPETAIAPFDRDREGFLIGEGAGTLILETREHAEERGADIYATIEGTGRTGDASHPTTPADDARGLSGAITDALDEADRAPGAVDYVNAHGTATPAGDKHESLAVNKAFDDAPPVTSTKSMLGHTRGAAGAIEAAVSAVSIRDGVIPPTTSYETPDPDCDVPVVDEKQNADVDVVVSNSAGFGGTNGTVVIGAYE